jgi:cyclohexyl-isocyanide hydratase
MISDEIHLQIGSLLFEGVDQIDLTGPFEVLSRVPNATYRIFAKTIAPVRDVNGLRLTPDATLRDAPQLDVVHVPGGFGQEALMDDEETLGWIRRQAAGARCVFSVCTGALICGAAGLLTGRRATTLAQHLLDSIRRNTRNERVVVDGIWFAAGVTAGIDGALRVAAQCAATIPRDDPAPHGDALGVFSSGTPETAPPAVLKARAVLLRPSRRSAKRRRGAAARLGIGM